MNKYAKALVAVLTAALSAVAAALVGDNTILDSEWVNVAIASVTAAAVYRAANLPGDKHIKAALAVLLGMLTVLNSVIGDGITGAEIIQVILAGLTPLGVRLVNNKGDVLDELQSQDAAVAVGDL